MILARLEGAERVIYYRLLTIVDSQESWRKLPDWGKNKYINDFRDLRNGDQLMMGGWIVKVSW